MQVTVTPRAVEQLFGLGRLVRATAKILRLLVQSALITFPVAQSQEMKAMNINLIGISQSNMALLYGGNVMSWIAAKVSADIGVQVNLYGGPGLTAYAGTEQLAGGYATQPNWINYDGSQFTPAAIQSSVDSYLSTVPAAGHTVVVYAFNETLSQNNTIDTATIEQMMVWQKAQTEAALGTHVSYAFDYVPYNFPSNAAANLYGTGGLQVLGLMTTAQHIREAEQTLAAQKSFDAVTIANQAVDMNAQYVWDTGQTNQGYGGLHYSPSDLRSIASSIVAALDHQLAAYAQPGSPVALAGKGFDWKGPAAISATRAGARTLDVQISSKFGINPLSAAAQQGAGWAVENSNGDIIYADHASLVGTDLHLTFISPIPAGDRLVYGAVDGRIALPGQPGLGAGVYDNNDLLLRVPAQGLHIRPAVQSPAIGAIPVAPHASLVPSMTPLASGAM